MRTCQAPNCNHPIDPHKPTNTLYCSNPCAAAAVEARKPPLRKCKNPDCNNLVSRRNSHHCSPACAEITKRKPPAARDCLTCNKPVPVERHASALTCSDECREVHLRAYRKEFTQQNREAIAQRKAKRWQAQSAIIKQELYESRPPCIICNKRMPYGKPEHAVVCSDACSTERRKQRYQATRKTKPKKTAAPRKRKKPVRPVRTATCGYAPCNKTFTVGMRHRYCSAECGRAADLQAKRERERRRQRGTPTRKAPPPPKPRRDHAAHMRLNGKPTFVRMPTVEQQIARAMTLFTDFGEAMQEVNQPPPEAPRQVQKPHLRA